MTEKNTTSVNLPARERWLASLLLSCVVVGMLLATWNSGALQVIGIVLIVGASVVSIVQFWAAGDLFNHVGQIEEQHSSLWLAWKTTLLISLVVGGTLFLICWACGAVYPTSLLTSWDKSAVHWFVIKLPTVLFQQVLLCWVLLPNAYRINGNRNIAVLLSAGAFSICHLPNPILMGLTFIAGAVWLLLFDRFRRLPPLVASHFVLAVCAATFCGEYVFNLRVGAACYQVLPKKVSAGKDQLWEFPGCVVGELDSVEQLKNGYRIGGWSFDPIHNYVPNQVNIKTSNGIQSYKLDPEQFANRDDKLKFTGELNRRCGFEFKIANHPEVNLETLEVFAENKNGWSSKIKLVDAVRPVSSNVATTPIILLNPKADGYFQVHPRTNGGLEVIGWAIDLDSTSPCKSIYQYTTGDGVHDPSMKEVALITHGINRPDIVKAYGSNSYLACGFKFELDGTNIERLRFFAKKIDGRLFELKLFQTEDRHRP